MVAEVAEVGEGAAHDAGAAQHGLAEGLAAGPGAVAPVVAGAGEEEDHVAHPAAGEQVLGIRLLLGVRQQAVHQPGEEGGLAGPGLAEQQQATAGPIQHRIHQGVHPGPLQIDLREVLAPAQAVERIRGGDGGPVDQGPAPGLGAVEAELDLLTDQGGLDRGGQFGAIPVAAHAEHHDLPLADPVHQADRFDQSTAGQGPVGALGVQGDEEGIDRQVGAGGAGKEPGGAPRQVGETGVVLQVEAQVGVGTVQPDGAARLGDPAPEGEAIGREEPPGQGLGDGQQAGEQLGLVALLDGAGGLAVGAVVARLPEGVVGALGGALQAGQTGEQVCPGMSLGELAVAVDLQPAGDQVGEVGLALRSLPQAAGPEMAEAVGEQAPLAPVGQAQAADGPLELATDGVAGQVVGEEQERSGAHRLVAGEDGVGHPVAGRETAIPGMGQGEGDREGQVRQRVRRGIRRGVHRNGQALRGELIAAVGVDAAVEVLFGIEPQAGPAAGGAAGGIMGHRRCSLYPSGRGFVTCQGPLHILMRDGRRRPLSTRVRWPAWTEA